MWPFDANAKVKEVEMSDISQMFENELAKGQDAHLYMDLDRILCRLINSCGGASPSQNKLFKYEQEIIKRVRDYG